MRKKTLSISLFPLMFSFFTFDVFDAFDAFGDTLPDGMLVWSSNRNDARHEIYLRDLKSPDVIRLTQNGGHFPHWSPDGQWIAYFNPDERASYIIRPDGSGEKKICDGIPAHWLQKNGQLLCGVPEEWVAYNDRWYTKKEVRFYSCSAATLECVYVFKKSDFKHLKDQALWPGGSTSDGRYMVGWVWGLFYQGYTADNGTFTSGHSSVILDLEDKSKIYFFGSGCLTAASPVGHWVYHVSRESDTMPDIFKMNIDDMMTRSSYQIELGHGDEEWGHEYMPSISNDNKYMVYVASTGCHDWFTCDYDVFLHRLGEDKTQRERLIQNPSSDIFPSLFIRGSETPHTDGGIPLDGASQPGGDAPQVAGSEDSGCAMTPLSREVQGTVFGDGSFMLLMLMLVLAKRSGDK